MRSPAGLTSKGELDREQHTSSLPTPVRKRGRAVGGSLLKQLFKQAGEVTCSVNHKQVWRICKKKKARYRAHLGEVMNWDERGTPSQTHSCNPWSRWCTQHHDRNLCHHLLNDKKTISGQMKHNVVDWVALWVRTSKRNLFFSLSLI